MQTRLYTEHRVEASHEWFTQGEETNTLIDTLIRKQLATVRGCHARIDHHVFSRLLRLHGLETYGSLEEDSIIAQK